VISASLEYSVYIGIRSLDIVEYGFDYVMVLGSNLDSILYRLKEKWWWGCIFVEGRAGRGLAEEIHRLFRDRPVEGMVVDEGYFLEYFFCLGGRMLHGFFSSEYTEP